MRFRKPFGRVRKGGDMGIVDLFKRRTVITEERAKELGTERLKPAPGIGVDDALWVFRGATVIRPEPEWWLEIPEADRLAILEEASHWIKKNGRWCRVVEDSKSPHQCHEKQCADSRHAKVVMRTWPDGKWDWMCHRCGRAVLIA